MASSMWWYSSKNQQKGPVTFEELSGLAQGGQIRSNDLVWKEGSPDWVKANTVSGLFDKQREAVRDDEPAPRGPSFSDRGERASRGSGASRELGDDRPRRSIRRPEGSSKGLMIGLIVGGAALVVIAVVVIIIVAMNSGSSTRNKEIKDVVFKEFKDVRPPIVDFKPPDFRDKFVVKPPPGGDVLPAARVIAAGPIPVNDALTNFDPLNPLRAGRRCKVFQVNMAAGRRYNIEMRSGGMDSYLQLVDSLGAVVAIDDDGGTGFHDARIIYNPPAAGPYRIVCTTFGPNEVGNFTLDLREE